MSKGLFDSIRISGSGLKGQRVKMDVVARNLANAETTRTNDGTPYRRQRAVFREVLEQRVQRQRQRLSPSETSGYGVTRTHPNHMSGLSPFGITDEEGILSKVEMSPDASEFQVSYDPGHPDADEEGY